MIAAGDALKTKHARYVLTPWMAQGNLQPPVIVRGEGIYLYDEDGNRYADLTSGLIAVNPRNAAANAGSRNEKPELGSAEPVVPTYITPAIALTRPEQTRAPIRKRFTRTPLSLATSRPRPVAQATSSWRRRADSRRSLSRPSKAGRARLRHRPYTRSSRSRRRDRRLRLLRSTVNSVASVGYT